jgi:23S rRNA pseudouridine1911/1915/1917 synthase
MEVIFVDNHILIAVKPPGIATQTHEGILGFEEQVKAWIKHAYKKAGNVFLQPVHRLDKSASGLLLFARTSKALARLHKAMREQQILKSYLAFVEGIPAKKEAHLEHFLIHDAFRARLGSRADGKRALLSYRLVGTREDASLLEVSLKTGRYHQIRAQLAAIGHPILGDVKYGSRKSSPQGLGIALHHARLQFKHPVTGVELIKESTPFFTF